MEETWIALKDNPSFKEDASKIVKETYTSGIDEWELIDIPVESMLTEFDVTMTENGNFFVYPTFLGETLTDFTPLLIIVNH